MLYYLTWFLPLLAVGAVVATGRISLRYLAMLALWLTLLSPCLTRIMTWLAAVPVGEVITFTALGNALVTGTFGLMVLLSLGQGKLVSLISNSIDYIVIIYIIWGLLFVIYPNQSFLEGIWGFKNNIVPIMWYFLARLLVKGHMDLRRLLVGIGVFLIFNNLYAIFQKLYGLVLPFDLYYYTTTAARLIKLHGERVYISGFLTGIEGWYVISIIGILCFGLRRALRLPIGLSLSLWTSLIALFLIHPERTPFVMIVIGIVTFLFLVSLKRPVRAVTLLLAVIFTAGILYTAREKIAFQLTHLGGQYAYFAGLFTPETDVSFQIRRNMNWSQALRLLRDNPFGIGMGKLCSDYASRFGTEWIGPHNYFLQVALGYSLLGLILFVMLIAGLIKQDLSLALQSDDPALRALGATRVGITLAMLAASFVVLPFAGISGSCYWLVMGLRLWPSKPSRISLGEEAVTW